MPRLVWVLVAFAQRVAVPFAVGARRLVENDHVQPFVASGPACWQYLSADWHDVRWIEVRESLERLWHEPRTVLFHRVASERHGVADGRFDALHLTGFESNPRMG